MVQDDRIEDFDFIADDAVSADDGAFDGDFLRHTGSLSHQAISSDLQIQLAVLITVG